MNNDNKAMFIFGFVFYFIGDRATTYIALNNGLSESGFIRVIGSSGLADMVIVKVIFFAALYFLIAFLEKVIGCFWETHPKGKIGRSIQLFIS